MLMVGAIVVGSGRKKAIDDWLAIDFRRFGDRSDVIVRGDQAAARVEAKAGSEFAFDTKPDFQF